MAEGASSYLNPMMPQLESKIKQTHIGRKVTALYLSYFFLVHSQGNL